jgi:uncharacterized membrane protein YhaH (DUF805 family)
LGRGDFWMRFTLPYLVISIVLPWIDRALGVELSIPIFDPMSGEAVDMRLGLLSFVFGIASLWPACAITAKRLHDRGKTGWWQLVYLIPLLGQIWLVIELGALRGSVGENRFGPDPVETTL